MLQTTNVPNPVFLTYDSVNGNIYAANHDTQLVSVIDSSSNTVINTITVGSDPTGVGFDPDNGNVYVGNQGTNFVSVIDGSQNQVIGSINVGSGPVTPVYDPVHRNIYVTNFHSYEAPGNTVSVISTGATTPPPDSLCVSISRTGRVITVHLVFLVIDAFSLFRSIKPIMLFTIDERDLYYLILGMINSV